MYILIYLQAQYNLHSTDQLDKMMNSNCQSTFKADPDQGHLMQVDSAVEISSAIEKVHDYVESLCISLLKPQSGEIRSIDITNIQLLKQLQRLWLTIPTTAQYGLEVYKCSFIYIRNTTISSLPLKELYIDIPLAMYGYHTHGLPSLLSHAKDIKLLKLHNIRSNMAVSAILSPLVDSSLVAFSFQGFICASPYCSMFDNKTMAILKSCPLKYIDISRNEISFLASGYIIEMRKLQYMDISMNTILTTALGHILLEIAFHPSLEVFVVNNLMLTEFNKSRRPRRSIKSIFELCQRRLNISNIFNSLLADRTFYCRFVECFLKFDGTLKLPCDVFPTYTDLVPLINFKCLPPIKIPILSRLKSISLSGMQQVAFSGDQKTYGRKRLVCFHNISLESFVFSWNRDLSRKLLMEDLFSNVEVLGLTTKIFDFRQNGINITFSNEAIFFRNMKIQKLYLSGNAVNFDKNFSLCEYLLTSIEVIDLSQTHLSTIPHNLFHNCSQLIDINLFGNRLTSLNLSLHYSTQLRSLNLSSNEIHVLDNILISSMQSLSSKNPFITDLTGNVFHCDCSSESIKTVMFIKNHKTGNLTIQNREQLLCIGNIDGKALFQGIHGLNMKDMLKSCSNDLTLLIVSLCTVNICIILFVASLLLLYRYRYRVKTWYFHHIYLRYKDEATNFETDVSMDNNVYPMTIFDGDDTLIACNKYDAFISYCAEDRFWVHNVLVKELEDKYGFKLCIHYRDFLAGRPIADEIVKNIKLSQVVVVVLSDNALKSSWMKYELDVAHTNSLNYQKKLLVLKLGRLPRADLTGVAQQIVDSRVYIEWPDLQYEADRYTTLRSSSTKHNEQGKTNKIKEEEFWYRVTQTLYGHSEIHCCFCCMKCGRYRRVVTNE